MPRVKDSASKSLGNKNGFDYCGERTYDIENLNSHKPFLNLKATGYAANASIYAASTSVLLELDAKEDKYIGKKTLKIKVCLKDYSAVTCSNITVVIDIKPCVILKFETAKAI